MDMKFKFTSIVKLFNVNYFDFTFLVLDKSSLDIGVFEVSEEFYLRGKEKTELE